MKLKSYLRQYIQKSDFGANIYKYLSKIKTRSLRVLPDRAYLKYIYFVNLGKTLHIDHPKTFNEKTQWLKLYDRKPLYKQLADKYRGRDFVQKVCGDKIKLIPLLGVWNNPEEIDFSALPQSFVLKCNHNSGNGMCICRDKSSLDYSKVVRDLKKGLQEDYYWEGREWQYRNIERKVIAEKFITDDSEGELKDYKVFVFNGKAKYIEVDYNRFTDHHRNFYDLNWNYVPFTTLYPTNPDYQVPCPPCLIDMIESAERLTKAAGTPPFLRIDLYVIGEKIYFGEITFHHGGGLEPFVPANYDEKLGNLMTL